jgi:hypothetical protein
MGYDHTDPLAFPCDFRDGLEFIRAENRSLKLLRVRRFIEADWRLKNRGRNLPEAQVQAVIKKLFLVRQRQPFANETEWREYAAKWLHWWNVIEIPRIRRSNATLLKKSVDPDNGDRG